MKDSKKVSLKELLTKYRTIIIPDIQRDYVLGSFEEKVTGLLNAFAKNGQEKDFDFSCVMGYVDDHNDLYIYDGQQRLTTLICLLTQCELTVEEKNLLRKFKFAHRENANLYIENLMEKSDGCKVVDYTTASMKQLVAIYGKQYRKFSKEFFFHKIKMEFVCVDKAGDAEQFFMDLNDGLDLKDYEISKAELYHRMNQILEPADFKRFALSMENRWLCFFRRLVIQEKTYWEKSLCEEEVLMKFVCYCRDMLYLEEGKAEADDFSELTKEHVERIEKILNYVCANDIMMTVHEKCIKYGLGKKHADSEIAKVNATFYNLEDNDYANMLTLFLKSFVKQKHESVYIRDVILWEYISKREMQESDLYMLLRDIKLFLNNNLWENKYAYYDENAVLWYTRYRAYGIPEYYTGVDYGDSGRETQAVFFNEVIKLFARFQEAYSVADIVSDNHIIVKSAEAIMQNRYAELPFGIIPNKEDYGLHTDEKCETVISAAFYYKDAAPCIFDDVTVKWPTYMDYKNEKQRYSAERDCRVAPQTYVDYILGRCSNPDMRVSDRMCKYMKYNKIMRNGWFDGNECYSMPRCGENGKFLSANSTYYDSPIHRRMLTEKVFEEEIYTYAIDKSNNKWAISQNGAVVQMRDLSGFDWGELDWKWMRDYIEKNNCELHFTSDSLLAQCVFMDWLFAANKDIGEVKVNHNMILGCRGRMWYLSARQIEAYRSNCM